MNVYIYIYILYIGRESNKSVNLIYAMVTKDNRVAKLAMIRDFTYALWYTVYDNTLRENTIIENERNLDISVDKFGLLEKLIIQRQQYMLYYYDILIFIVYYVTYDWGMCWTLLYLYIKCLENIFINL